ncbi:dienelactone hydrolase family protein [Polyangium jinanense]|uniref:Dienelactone hydrolase family protein n=1 Tax=Polyangium jinanense TaxID=2829994 RepID=A0A9X3XFR7_9BACT|nr:dienelactone hydrolase family protein [Polyangium jinanense]MDC3958825.1 dienelactone hydrolase family protein [Polyangium jinanense]MDC3989187.1 dienelactone hydrolase family protein [Polyangium jinanense]
MVNERAETSPVCMPADGVMLNGDLGMPAGARGVVLFAHGSGSSRFSQRNRHVAASLRARGFATLLVDLLTAEEEAVDLRTAEIRFDINLLARRVTGVVDWLGRASSTAGLGIGLFGASTGAAAALVAAAERPDAVLAVVSRGGRPDLAGPALPKVQAPTLLIVGGADTLVIDLNQQAFEDLRCEREIVIIPRATHLFEEPGALDQVADLAGHWFEAHIAPQGRRMARAS